MEKLVRDRIAEIIKADTGREPKTRTASISEMPDALLAKLEEEMIELTEAATANWLGERADVEEVLLALDNLDLPTETAAKLRRLKESLAELDRLQKVDAEELRRIRLAKRKARGGFDKRIMWTKED